jgi:hypothetical protein
LHDFSDQFEFTGISTRSANPTYRRLELRTTLHVVAVIVWMAGMLYVAEFCGWPKGQVQWQARLTISQVSTIGTGCSSKIINFFGQGFQ